MPQNSWKSCFVVAPIGHNNSAIRERSDKIMKHVIRPVCKSLKVKAVRADELEESGVITRKVISNLMTADLVVADLTGHNPNVFYELALRHMTGKPLVQLLEENEKLPFDVADYNTIFINHQDLNSVATAKIRLKRQIKHALDIPFHQNPVTDVLAGLSNELPVSSRDTNIEKVLQSMMEKVLVEINNLRADKDILLRNVIEAEQDTSYPKKTAPVPQIIDLTGIWSGSYGQVKLRQKGTAIFGEYQYFEKSWIGDIIGEIVEEKVIFSWGWKSGSNKGCGYWHIGNDTLEGGWVYSDAQYSYDKFIRYPKIVDNIHFAESNKWSLKRIS